MNSNTDKIVTHRFKHTDKPSMLMARIADARMIAIARSAAIEVLG